MAASSQDYISLSPTLIEWIKKEIKHLYEEYLSYIKESGKDPEEEPYRSLYSARKTLLLIKDKIGEAPPEINDSLHPLSITLSSLLAANYINTDETSAGQREYESILELSKSLECQGRVAFAMVTACNGLRILWSNRSEEYEKSLELLKQGETLYKPYHHPPPLSDDDLFTGDIRDEGEREKTFEDLHTHTLFYLAQVYTHLDQQGLSAQYCQNTLSRQLETMKNLIVEDKVTKNRMSVTINRLLLIVTLFHIAGVVSMHCSDHIIMLISDIISKSTLTLASCLTDTVSPHSPSPLKNWPEMNFKSDQRHTLEFHLKIKSKMNENPVMWKILILISNNRSGFLKCSSLIYSLLFVLILNWRKGRSAPSISYNEDLLSTTQLIQSLATAKWLVKPLCYVSELFSELSCEDIARLLEICDSFIYNNYQNILKGKIPTEDSLPDSSWSTLKAILRQNINKFGNIYYRFVSREHITTN